MTKIQCTDVTENPIYLKREDGSNGGHWCRKHSPGCTNCFAEKINNSGFFSFASQLEYKGKPPENLTFDRTLSAKWRDCKKPRRRFICSMTDLFGSWVPLAWQFAIFDDAAAAPMQAIQLLTKRPDLALESILAWLEARNLTSLPSNLWIGASIEDQATADERIPIMMKMPASVVWLSAEPLLSPIDLTQAMYQGAGGNSAFGFTDGIGHEAFFHQVIVGGESGPKSRDCNIAWIEDLVDQCGNGKGVPVFVKQFGSKSVGVDRDGKTHRFYGKGGNFEQFPPHLQLRQFPEIF